MAVGVTSLIVVPYKRDHTIDDVATVKNGEAVFTHGSPRSSAPGTDRGTPVAIRSRGPGHGALDRVTGARRGRTPVTHGWVLAQDVPVRACAQPCHSADVNVQEAVLKWLNSKGCGLDRKGWVIFKLGGAQV